MNGLSFVKTITHWHFLYFSSTKTKKKKTMSLVNFNHKNSMTQNCSTSSVAQWYLRAYLRNRKYNLVILEKKNLLNIWRLGFIWGELLGQEFLEKSCKYFSFRLVYRLLSCLCLVGDKIKLHPNWLSLFAVFCVVCCCIFILHQAFLNPYKEWSIYISKEITLNKQSYHFWLILWNYQSKYS